MNKVLLIFALTIMFSASAAAQGSSFSFQGRLNDGSNPANGAYDLQFKLYTAVAGGTQIGSTVSRPNTPLVNGVFSVALDFGAGAFNSPASIFIEIAVRPNGSPNAYTVLGPRQQLTVVPYALKAAAAVSADTAVNAQNAVNATNATNATTAANATNATNATTALTAVNALSLGGAPASEFARLNIVNNGDLKTTGGLFLDGDIRQFSTAGGAVKAMALIRVVRTSFPSTATATVVRCFSGIALPTANNCGITFGNVFTTSGVEVDFGFTITNRFLSVAANNQNTGGAFISGYPNATSVTVIDGVNSNTEFFIFVY